MHNIPDDCANNPLAPWNEKRVHPGDVFELAAKGNFDALDHIGGHAKMWLGVDVVAMAVRELAMGSVECAEIADELDRLLRDCQPVGIHWIGGDSWLTRLARDAIGESLHDNLSDRDIARLLVACAQAGKGGLSPEFPREDFDNWQDMCQQDWEEDQ